MENARTACPACGATAFYRYGRTGNGKKRRLCLICSRQYVVDGPTHRRASRPNCPACDAPMHRYRRQGGYTRFRCSNYPACRKYLKVAHAKGS